MEMTEDTSQGMESERELSKEAEANDDVRDDHSRVADVGDNNEDLLKETPRISDEMNIEENHLANLDQPCFYPVTPGVVDNEGPLKETSRNSEEVNTEGVNVEKKTLCQPSKTSFIPGNSRIC